LEPFTQNTQTKTNHSQVKQGEKYDIDKIITPNPLHRSMEDFELSDSGTSDEKCDGKT